MIAEMCRKAQANAFTRKNYDAAQNRRLLEKQVSTDVIENGVPATFYRFYCNILSSANGTITLC